MQIAHEAPALALRDLRDLLGVTCDRGELECAEQDHERGQRRGLSDGGHAATSRTSSVSYSARSTVAGASAGTSIVDDEISSLTASAVIALPAPSSSVRAAATSASIVLAARWRIRRYSRSPRVPARTSQIASYALRNTNCGNISSR